MKTIYVVVEDYAYEVEYMEEEADLSDAIVAFTAKEKAEHYIKEHEHEKVLHINEVLLIED